MGTTRLVSFALVSLAMTSVASAADRPIYKASAPLALAWTGFYVGGNVGYDPGIDPTTMSTVSGAGFPGLAPGTALYGLPQNFDLVRRGVFGGAQTGYNWQAAPNFAVGVEADIQAGAMKDSQNCIIPCGSRIITAPGAILSLFPVTFSDISAQHQIDWFGTVRARVGYTSGPVWLYLTGGLAYADITRSGRVAGSTVNIVGATVNTFAGSFSNSSVKFGWTAGAGVEGQLGGNWSLKAEYLYMDLGSTSDSFNTIFLTSGGGAVAGTVAATRTDSSKIRDHLFRLGLNYKLGAPVYMAAPPPSVFAWNGFYVGGNLGYGVGIDPTTMSTISGAGFPIIGAGTALYGLPQNFDLAPRGVIAGAQAGYNWRAAPMWAFGIEADIQGSAMKDSQTCIIPCGSRIITVNALPFVLFPVTFTDISAQHKIDWFGTVRGRFGYTTGPFWFYFTGGLAYAEVARSGRVAGSTLLGVTGATVNTFAGSFSNSSVKAGWTVGTGVEGQLGGNWSVKAEYLYMDLGSTADSFNTIYLTGGGGAVAGTVAATRTDTSKIRDHIYRIGLNYRFGS